MAVPVSPQSVDLTQLHVARVLLEAMGGTIDVRTRGDGDLVIALWLRAASRDGGLL